MIKMVALKKVYYPRGRPEAREYTTGEEFNVLSEKDATTLRLLKVAKDAPTAAIKDMESEKPTRRYNRRDMRPAEE